MPRPSFPILVVVVVLLNIFSIINTQHLPLCDTINEIEGKENEEIKSRRIRALCDAIHSSKLKTDHDELNAIPDFDLTKIGSDNEAEQILRRFRRKGGRGGGGGGSRGGGGGSRSGGGRFSSSGSRFSSSFSRSSSGSRSWGSRSSSSSGGSRFFSRSGSSSGSSGTRIFSRSGTSSSGGGYRFFSRSHKSPSTSGQSGHRVREAIRSVFRKPSTSSGGGISSGSTSRLSGTDGVKPSFGDKIRQITHGSGGTHGFGSGGSGGGGVWVRTAKSFLPQAARFGKRYYQRRKYNQGLYGGAGYYAGARYGSHHYHHYPQGHYGYPPAVQNPPDKVENKTPTVFYCIQEDLNTTLLNTTLDKDGFGICNVSGKYVVCPIEIECKMSEADNCCEDEQGAPYCCGGPIPEEFISQYGGYEDDIYDTGESINTILNMITVISVFFATICFTMWHRRE